MSKLSVNLQKLEKYAALHGGYEILKDKNQITVSFVPAFPEALEKGDDSSPPRVIMTGELMRERVEFSKVEVEDSAGLRTRDQKEAELVYGSWLEFIEENY